tara:strand:+ start:1323 stop:2504 length:1182 start_codon:yes stop_codon:yes gene_type:complete
MPNIQALNGVSGASVQAVNGVAVADIQAINGFDVPSGPATASRWVVTTADGFFFHLPANDLTSPTAYDAYDEGTANQNTGDGESVCFGKNGSGQDVYIATRSRQNGGTQTRELTISGTDVTATSEWTNIDLDGTGSLAAIMQVVWSPKADGSSGGTWVAVGKQGSANIYRSTDGTNWSAVSLSGISGHEHGGPTKPYLNGVATDGQGRFMTSQEDRIYYSTDDGQTWASSTPFGTNNKPGRFQGICFTNNSWVLCYSRSSQVRYRSCAASDITDWGNEVTSIGVAHGTSAGRGAKMAAANGNVCVCMENDTNINRFTVSGKTIGTVSDTGTIFSALRGIATDGNQWVAIADDGDLYESTDNGANWNQRLDAYQANGSQTLDLHAVCADVLLPL